MQEEKTKTITNNNLPNTPLLPSPLIIINNNQCTICKKYFKSSRGFSRHMSIIQKYNEIPFDQEKVPDFLINKFKEDIIYLIHTRLSKNSKNTSLQVISMACPVSLYKLIFKGYIHYYKKRTGTLRCIFRGPAGYQELTSIFNNPNWGVKYYPHNQQTFVQLSSSSYSQLQENPLFKLRQQKSAIATKKNFHKSRYPYGEVVIEWKQKKDIDAKGNVCQGGFIYIHFFVSRKMFV